MTEILRLKYMKPPTASILKRELVDATMLMLAGSSVGFNPDYQVPASEAYGTIRRDLWEKIKSLAVLPENLIFSSDSPTLARLMEAPRLQVTDSKNIIQLTLPNIEETKYKSQERLVSNEIHKFLLACQVRSTKFCIAMPKYSTPVLKSNFGAFEIAAKYQGSASKPNLVYIQVPAFVSDLCAKYYPDAVVNMAPAELLADQVDLVSTPAEDIAPW